MYHIFIVHLLIEGRLGCFQLLAITNNAAMNIVEHMSLLYDWASFGYMPNSGIARSCSKLFPNFLRTHHTDFQSSCTSLHSHQQWRNVILTLHSLQHKLLALFLILAILTAVRWNLRVVLICISLIAKDIKLFLKCLSALWDLSLESSLSLSINIISNQIFNIWCKF